MANLQAIGVDGLTTVFLWATGTGTDQDPYKSNFYAYQGGDWAIAVNNFPSSFNVGNFPSAFASTQSGNWSVSVDNFPSTVAVTGTFWQATQPVSFGSLPAGSNVIGNIGNTTFDIGNFPATQEITASALPLPTGASTSAKQDTGNNSLSSIDTKLPNNLTVTSTRLLVDGSGVTQPISGTVTANTGFSQPLTDAQLRAAAVPVSGDFYPATQPVSLSSLPSLATGSNTIGAISNTGFNATQSGLWNVSVNNFPSSVEIANDSGNPIPVSGTVTANTGLSQPLTNTELRASPIPIIEGLSIPSYDYMSLTYSNSNLSQVIYRTGGVNGTIVATLNLSYDLNNNVTSITKV